MLLYLHQMESVISVVDISLKALGACQYIEALINKLLLLGLYFIFISGVVYILIPSFFFLLPEGDLFIWTFSVSTWNLI